MSFAPVAAQAFGAMAQEYQRGRPGWPAGAVAALVERFGARDVLDLAAGTGKLTEVLAPVADVVAVEPVEGMRRVLEARLPSVRVLAGTAEAIPLPDASVDAVFVAEAFHWFDLARAPAEIARVLRPGGGLAVMWNMAGDDGEPWFDEMVALVQEHRVAGGGEMRADTVAWREALEPRFGPLRDEEVAHAQLTDRDGIVDQIASFSSIGALPLERRRVAVDAARALLVRYGVDAISLQYKAAITTGRRRDDG
ncbi:MAG TPA: methyltransferase domain-containing protein [Solirubrobacteraceae bacterium]|nr:methyltransferase domain-containing protein [Solirubrobacteraceae bacterium]